VIYYLENEPNAEILALNGDIERGVIVKEKMDDGEEDHEWMGIMMATDDVEFIRAFWRSLPNGHKYFLPLRMDAFENLLKITGAKVKWQTHCKVFVYSLEDDFVFDDDTKYPYDILTAADVNTVEEFYEYQHDELHLEILESIEKRNTSCIRIDGDLAAWCLVGEDGSLGPLHTKEKYRRKGLGKLVASRLIQKQLAQGKIPYVHINDDNISSLSLIKKFPQMKYSHNAIWFGAIKGDGEKNDTID